MIQIYRNYCFSYEITLTLRQNITDVRTLVKSIPRTHYKLAQSCPDMAYRLGWQLEKFCEQWCVCNDCTMWKSTTDLLSSSKRYRLLALNMKWKIRICWPNQLGNYNIESKYIVIKVGYKRKFGRERNWIKKKSAKTEMICLKACHLE